jgi:hypothetical protein
MRKIAAFSKEIVDQPCIHTDENGDRAGFTDHVKTTKVARREPKSGLADFQKDADLPGNESYPDFKKRSDDGLPDFPAPFSKKSIPGGPR